MMQEPASETGGLVSVVPPGPWVIIFGRTANLTRFEIKKVKIPTLTSQKTRG